MISTKAKLTDIYSIVSTQLIIIIALFAGVIIWKPLAVFFVPGIIILFFRIATKVDFTCLLFYLIGISLSFWIASFWVLDFIPLTLTSYFLIVTTLTTLLIVYFLFLQRQNQLLAFESYNFIVLATFLCLLCLRFLPLYYCITPSGADMSMHTYITNLIVKHNGIPDNYYPIIGIQEFSSFPVGFHTISALISLLGNIPAYRSAFIMSCFSFFMLTAFLFTFLRRFLSWEVSLISSIAFTLFTENPQGFSGWGGNPTIFAFGFLIFFMATLDELESDKSFFLASSLALSAVFLTHSIIFIQSLYIVGTSFLIYFFLNIFHFKSRWARYLLIILFFLILIFPYLINFNYSIATATTQDWIKNWVRNSGHVWHGTAKDFYWTIPVYMANYIFGNTFFIYSLPLCLIGLIILFIKLPKRGVQYAIFLLSCISLILNAHYWILPLSYAIYPERVAIMTIIPLSVFLGYPINQTLSFIKNNKIKRTITISVLLIALILSPSSNWSLFVERILSFSPVTKDDLAAFTWLDNNIEATDIIKNNYGDAGLWIPGIILRGITHPHVNVVYLDKLRSLGKPKFLYIGKKCVYPENCILKNSLFNNTNKYKLVYDKNGVYIYQLL